MSDETNNGGETPNITVEPRRRPSLADPQFDPFNKYKKEEDKFYYRAINTRPHLLRKREAEGYQPIKGSEYGDLVLARIPKEDREAREKYLKDKAKSQLRSARESFHEQAARHGVKTYEER